MPPLLPQFFLPCLFLAGDCQLCFQSASPLTHRALPTAITSSFVSPFGCLGSTAKSVLSMPVSPVPKPLLDPYQASNIC